MKEIEKEVKVIKMDKDFIHKVVEIAGMSQAFLSMATVVETKDYVTKEDLETVKNANEIITKMRRKYLDSVKNEK